jgi:hypothetical protein
MTRSEPSFESNAQVSILLYSEEVAKAVAEGSTKAIARRTRESQSSYTPRKWPKPAAVTS